MRNYCYSYKKKVYLGPRYEKYPMHRKRDFFKMFIFHIPYIFGVNPKNLSFRSNFVIRD